MKRYNNKTIKQSNSAGFTFIEALLYIGLVTIIMSSIIPYAWNIIEGGAKSAYQEEVVENARYISERIKYEIRNSLGINSGTGGSQIVLCQTTPCPNVPTQTTIALSGTDVTIVDNGVTPAVKLNSNSVHVTNLAFTNNTSGSTENISFTMTVATSYAGTRKDFIYSTSLRSSAEVRSN